jgi:hypothetical protein
MLKRPCVRVGVCIYVCMYTFKMSDTSLDLRETSWELSMLRGVFKVQHP